MTLSPPDWTFDESELRAAFNARTRGIVINTPNNPTGKVFSREELDVVAELCQRWDAVVFTDEIYEHITYDGFRHVPPGAVPGLEDRTVTISALSKTYAVTGWRVGWVVAPDDAHGRDPLGARLPHGGRAGTAPGGRGGRPRDARVLLRADSRSSTSSGATRSCGSSPRRGSRSNPTRGAYYVMADVSHLGMGDDVEVANRLTKDVGVAVVPGSSFFSRPELGTHLVRFAFCKRIETLEEAGARLRKAFA